MEGQGQKQADSQVSSLTHRSGTIDASRVVSGQTTSIDKSRVNVIQNLPCEGLGGAVGRAWCRDRSGDKQVPGTGWGFRGEGGNRGGLLEGR